MESKRGRGREQLFKHRVHLTMSEWPRPCAIVLINTRQRVISTLVQTHRHTRQRRPRTCAIIASTSIRSELTSGLTQAASPLSYPSLRAKELLPPTPLLLAGPGEEPPEYEYAKARPPSCGNGFDFDDSSMIALVPCTLLTSILAVAWMTSLPGSLRVRVCALLRTMGTACGVPSKTRVCGGEALFPT